MTNNKFNKESFSELLKKAIGANRSISEFAKDCNVARPYISKFINCKLDKAPSTDIISKFAKAAVNDVNEHDLLFAAGYELDKTDYFNLAFEPIVNDVDSSAITATRNKLQLQEQKNNSIHRIPVEVPVLSFIDPGTIINQEAIDYYEYVPASNNYDTSKCFYYICDDKSMVNSRINKGDLVFIIPTESYQHNDIVLLLIDGETYIRRYKKLNNLNLFQAENNEFDSFIFTNAQLKNSSVTIIGTVDHVKTRTKL